MASQGSGAAAGRGLPHSEARPLVEQRVAVMKAELQDKQQRASRLAAENAIMRQKLAS